MKQALLNSLAIFYKVKQTLYDPAISLLNAYTKRNEYMFIGKLPWVYEFSRFIHKNKYLETSVHQQVNG